MRWREFVAFFDDDDESRQDRLTKQRRRLTDYERLRGAELVLCYANRDVVGTGQTRPEHVAMAIGREPPEPSGRIVATVCSALRRKRKDYLINEKAYLASVAMADAWFHGNAGHYLRHRLFLALAYGLLPPSILAAKLASRRVGHHAKQAN
jgi:hypothetical protein